MSICEKIKIVPVLVMFSCGGTLLDENERPGVSNVATEEGYIADPELEEVFDDRVVYDFEADTTESVEGFSYSDESRDLGSREVQDIESYFSSIKDDDRVEDPLVFDYQPPENMKTFYSEPVMVAGSGLNFVSNLKFKTFFANCSSLPYSREQPTLEDLILIANRSKLCNQITYYFCIKHSFKEFVSSKSNAIYIQTPERTIYIPCVN